MITFWKASTLIPGIVALVLLSIDSVMAQPPDQHDIYDLRVGVERYYTPCVPIPDVITCGLSVYAYRSERVVGIKELNGQTYAEIERLYISNERWITSRGFIYQRIDGQTLLQLREDKDGLEEVAIYRFDFAPGDSVKSFIRDLERDEGSDGGPWQNQSVVSADTVLAFPDGEEYRIVYGSDGTNPWDNARLVEELSAGWSNTVIRNATLGARVVAFDWLVPFANMEGALSNPPFHIGTRTFYHVSRFGPILSSAYTGYHYLAGFKSHDGRMYGYFHDGIPVGIDRVEDESAMEFRLLGNYPNPFNPSTQIVFQVAEPSDLLPVLRSV